VEGLAVNLTGHEERAHEEVALEGPEQSGVRAVVRAKSLDGGRLGLRGLGLVAAQKRVGGVEERAQAKRTDGGCVVLSECADHGAG
jgi:hypothetical protein